MILVANVTRLEVQERPRVVRSPAPMDPVSFYGVLCLAVILPIFYFVRKIGAYVALCVMAVAAFAVMTLRYVDGSRPWEWLVMIAGLLLCIFGLLIVRVMLVRSVSLRLLAAMDSGAPETTGDDIGRRLHDMRALRLVRLTSEGKNALTGFGWLVSSIVAVFYFLFRIDT